MIGRAMLDIPEDRRAPEGEGCKVCGIVLEDDCILSTWCSPECAEYEDRCLDCECGPSWCRCEEGYAP